MNYQLQLLNTIAGVGCFAAMPTGSLSLNDMLAHQHARPMDEFMRRQLVQKLGEMPHRKVERMVRECVAEGGRKDPVLAALLYEACHTHMRLTGLRPLLAPLDPAELAAHSPGVLLRSLALPDQAAHRAATAALRPCVLDLAPVPARADLPEPPPGVAEANPAPGPAAAEVRARLARAGLLPPPAPRRPALETIRRAGARLEAAEAFASGEAMHRASLSPTALLRHWSVDVTVRHGRHANTLFGLQTCYGRGLDLLAARASCLMECAERFSSYAAVDANGVRHRAAPMPLEPGSFADLAGRGALDPAALRLEVPYLGQTLHWVRAEAATACDGPGAGRPRPALVPAQLAFLFLNLDEPELFSALGSTGLASGNTLAEARVSGLCEVLERDAAAVTPFDPARCFRLTADDFALAALLGGYEQAGVQVWFQDCTTEFGVPCYKSIVLGPDGDVNQGMGCGLDGRRAVLSALTETAWPFPGPASGPAPADLPVRRLEDLPDACTGSAEGDGLVLDQTLLAHGYTPYTVDLTRADLEIPVVRMVVPGLEIVADFDRYSRLSPRLWANVARLAG
ncbi:MAG: YcaO-like family protein [Desulfovibrionaceae bacterium]